MAVMRGMRLAALAGAGALLVAACTSSGTRRRPDPRPDVREDAAVLGNLYADFDFRQSPRPPVLLPTHPAPGPAAVIP